MMIDEPSIRLHVSSTDQFRCSGPASDRVREFARDWANFHGVSLPACEIRVRELPPQHVGLGVGTQLALSVSAALSALTGMPLGSARDLAAAVGRGRRSAIGTHGFLRGGLLIDRGKRYGEGLADLDFQHPLPTAWRFVLVRPQTPPGLSGSQEESAFARLPRDRSAARLNLIRLLRQQLAPAVARADFPRFADSLHRFGHAAGQEFSAVQGGAYNGPLLNRLVDYLRREGAPAVAQSSWGPTLFAAFETEREASDFVQRVEAARDLPCPLTTHQTSASNEGARIQTDGAGKGAGKGADDTLRAGTAIPGAVADQQVRPAT